MMCPVPSVAAEELESHPSILHWLRALRYQVPTWGTDLIVSCLKTASCGRTTMTTAAGPHGTPWDGVGRQPVQDAVCSGHERLLPQPHRGIVGKHSAVRHQRSAIPETRRDRGQAHPAAVFQLGVPLDVSAER